MEVDIEVWLLTAKLAFRRKQLTRGRILPPAVRELGVDIILAIIVFLKVGISG